MASKVLLITGASSGIGAATARAAAVAGFHLALVARRADRLNALALETGALAVQGDVTRQDDLDDAVTRAVKEFGQVDAVFANAGVFHRGSLADGNPDEWADVINVNLTGVFRTVRAVLPHMIERGSGDVIMTSSIAGRVVYPGGGIYSATKFALYAVAEALRKETHSKGVRVSVIAPGYVANELWGDGSSTPDAWAAEADKGEALLSADIAAAVVYALQQPHNVNIADMLVLPSRLDVPSM